MIEEGCSLIRAELVAREATHHFFTTTSGWQHLALHEIDQGFHNCPTPPLHIQAEAFP